MSVIPHVVVVMARCRQDRRPFGIRFEEHALGAWVGDWAFALREGAAEREGYDRNRISGQFTLAEEFPGCPHCQDDSVFKCACGKVSCWDGKSPTVTCPWCGEAVALGGTIDSLEAGEDR